MSKEERIENWQRIIAKQEASGMTARAFCLENDINPWRFYRWRRRVREHTDGGFLQLLPATDSRSAGTDTGIRIHLNPTISIELARGFDSSALRCVVDTLSRCRGVWPCSL